MPKVNFFCPRCRGSAGSDRREGGSGGGQARSGGAASRGARKRGRQFSYQRHRVQHRPDLGQGTHGVIRVRPEHRRRHGGRLGHGDHALDGARLRRATRGVLAPGGSSRLQIGRRAWDESKKLWVIVAPAIFSRVVTYSMNVITQAYAGHLGDLELAAFSIANTVVIGFNFGLLEYKMQKQKGCQQKEYKMKEEVLSAAFMIKFFVE